MTARRWHLKIIMMAAALYAAMSACVPFQEHGVEEGVTLTAMQCGRRWRRLDGAMPPSRLYPSVTEVAGGVAIFGGFGAEGVRDDGWLWNGRAWSPLPAEGAPSARSGHVAVWTAEALCVWGGEADGAVRGDGACWSPATGAWRAMSSDGAPSARTYAGACWTGRALVVFGGQNADGDTLGDGAAWDPATNRWRPLASTGAPKPRRYPLVTRWPVDGGDGALVWGGAGDELALGGEDAAVYDPARDAWTPVDLANAPPARSAPLSAVTPDGVWAWSREGVARLDAATARWQRSAPEDAPAMRFAATPVLVPGGVFVWGGRDEASVRGDGACHDLARDRWTAAPVVDAPPARADAVTFWDGRAVLVLWGQDERGLRDDAWSLER